MGILGGLSEAEARIAELEAELALARAHILDIAAHATPFGDIPGEPGWIGQYLLTAGALHRALGTLGHSMASCGAEARVAALEAERAQAAPVLAAAEAYVDYGLGRPVDVASVVALQSHWEALKDAVAAWRAAREG